MERVRFYEVMKTVKNTIDLKAIADQEIGEKGYALADLWMVKDQFEKVHGPYYTLDLKEYIEEHTYLFDETQVFNLQNEVWHETFKVNHFQRRKPALVSAQNLIKDNRFFVLIDGQKQGPYRQDEIQAMLNQETILPSGQISLDNGESWIKLYEHHAFDRRTKKSNQELPFIPDNKVLEAVDYEPNNSTNDEAVFDLAYQGTHKKAAPQKVVQIKVDRARQSTKAEPTQFNYKIPAGFMVALVMALIGFNQFSGDDKAGQKLANGASKTEQRSINNESRKRGKSYRAPASIPKKAPKVNRTVEAKRKPARVKPKRFKPKVTRKRTRPEVQKIEKTDIFEKEIENIDINDPEVQEEITRQLAGEDGLDPEMLDERMDEFNEEDDYDGDEEPELHSIDDYN